MSGSRGYLLDANVFIEASKRYYGFSICPGFWKALIAHHRNNRVFSTDRVRAELADEGDQLSNWSQSDVPDTFFKKTHDQAVIAAFQEMVKWVNAEPQFTPAAKAEFAGLDNADGWVMAYAKSNGLIVVTHEEYAPDAQKKVPMPNVCLEFNVDYVNTFEMLEDLKIKFILSTKRQRSK
jgi:hypothetical protein